MRCSTTAAPSLSGVGGAIRPGIVHRIDKDTSGLLVVAKNDAAHQGLSAQMAVHSIHRVYHAVVYGNLKEDAGTVEAPIGRDARDRKKMAVTQQNAKYACTHWQVLERFGRFTYIACKLETGRTHQIRVHMAHIGHPLAGGPRLRPAPRHRRAARPVPARQRTRLHPPRHRRSAAL